MKVNPEIDYTNIKDVKKLMADIEKAIRENGVSKGKICEIADIAPETYSRFRQGKKGYVSEERIRALSEAVNRFDTL